MNGNIPEQMRKHPCENMIIHGLRVRIVFSAEQNTEAARLVREILKCGYLLRQGV